MLVLIALFSWYLRWVIMMTWYRLILLFMILLLCMIRIIPYRTLVMLTKFLVKSFLSQICFLIVLKLTLALTFFLNRHLLHQPMFDFEVGNNSENITSTKKASMKITVDGSFAEDIAVQMSSNVDNKIIKKEKWCFVVLKIVMSINVMLIRTYVTVVYVFLHTITILGNRYYICVAVWALLQFPKNQGFLLYTSNVFNVSCVIFVGKRLGIQFNNIHEKLTKT